MPKCCWSHTRGCSTKVLLPPTNNSLTRCFLTRLTSKAVNIVTRLAACLACWCDWGTERVRESKCFLFVYMHQKDRHQKSCQHRHQAGLLVRLRERWLQPTGSRLWLCQLFCSNTFSRKKITVWLFIQNNPPNVAILPIFKNWAIFVSFRQCCMCHLYVGVPEQWPEELWCPNAFS